MPKLYKSYHLPGKRQQGISGMAYFKLQSYMFTGNMSQKEISYNVPFLKLLGHVILQISILHVHRNMSQKEIPYDVPFLRLLGHVILKKYQRRVFATTTLPSPVKCKTASRNLLSRDSTLSASSGSPWQRIFIMLFGTYRGRQVVICKNARATKNWEWWKEMVPIGGMIVPRNNERHTEIPYAAFSTIFLETRDFKNFAVLANDNTDFFSTFFLKKRFY